MKRPLAALTAAVVVMAATAALALASAQTLHDEEGDSTSDVDIAVAKVAFDGKHVVFTVKAYGKLPGGNNPCVEVKRDSFVACFGSRISGGDFDGVPVKVDNGRKKNEFTVSWRKLGRPPKISWRAVFLEEDQPADAAPDHGYSAVALKP